MDPSTRQRAQQRSTERTRGWVINFLYSNRPEPLEFPVLLECLAEKSIWLSRRAFAAEIDFLRSLKLIRVFTDTSRQELDEVTQARLLQQYVAVRDDGELEFTLFARLSPDGIWFHEGVKDVEGVQLVR